MSFESDSLIDRKRLKRRLGLWRLAAVIAIAGIGLALFSRFDAAESTTHIARLTVRGIIVDDRKRIEALDHISRDANVKALIISIDSPGGTVVGGESLYRQIRDFAAKKPVVAVIGTLGTSGGYMVAIGADHIIARAGTITGSIGVIMQTTNLSGLLEKIGVKAEAIKSDPLKAVPSPFEHLTDKGRAATQVIVQETHRQFLAIVAERRRLTPAKTRELGNGRIFTGSQAVTNGLIDAIGGEREARAWLKKTHKISTSLPIRDIRINRGTANLFGLVEEMFGKTLFSERLTLDGLISLWQPE
jgi:protease-4